MKANDLRIGNYWQSGTTKEIRCADWLDIRDMADGRLYHEPIAITLTEEWHNNFGVQKNGFKNFEYDICPFGNKSKVFIFSGDYLYIRDMSGKDRSEDDLITIWNKDIKKEFYVHEWQNLYFAFTGKELKII